MSRLNSASAERSLPLDPYSPQGRHYDGFPHPQHPTFTTPRRTWTFPGFRPYVEHAAAAVGLGSDTEDLNVLAMSRDGWHGRRAQQLLGQMPDVIAKLTVEQCSPEAVADLMNHLRRLYLSAVALQQAIGAAILDTTSELELPYPQWIEPHADPPRKKRDCK